MNSLAVITMTKGLQPFSLGRCIDSVKSMLPADAHHYVIECKDVSKWAQIRIECLGLAPYIAFVDDDDIVVNNSISISFDVIKNNDVGVVFTDEALVDKNGKILSIRCGPRLYEANQTKPWQIHHFSVIKTACCIDDMSALLGLTDGVDWFMRSNAIKHAGALHVPIVGYHWTQHDNMMSRNQEKSKLVFDIGRKGFIPTVGT